MARTSQTSPTVADPTGSTAAEAQIDWTGSLAVETVASLKPEKTVDDIPASIREVADKAFTSKDTLQVTLPNGIAAKSFCKHLRDYTYLHKPRWTARTTVQPDGVSVRFRVAEYVEPKAADAAK